MSDRGFLFLFSILMIVGGLATAGWLFATGQAATVDGLFLLCTVLLVALCFVLYVIFMIRSAMEAAKPAQTAKAGAAKAAKPAPATASQA
jgi:TRAP-type C4-dicarboxylate transport system permease small subunit